MKKTIAELNDCIQSGQTVIITARDLHGISEQGHPAASSEQVDMVTSGTRGPMLYFAGRLPSADTDT